jgi:predicted nucleic acid-binding protein
MKQLFFDAAYIGKLHWVERGSTEVQAFAGTADQIVYSHHGRAEFYSIGFRKVREGLAAPATLKSVFAQFNADITTTAIVLLPLTDTILDRVESAFATAPATTYLRAADAIHLATAAEHGFTKIHSNDKHLLASAPLFGLVGVNVIPQVLLH